MGPPKALVSPVGTESTGWTAASTPMAGTVRCRAGAGAICGCCVAVFPAPDEDAAPDRTRCGFDGVEAVVDVFGLASGVSAPDSDDAERPAPEAVEDGADSGELARGRTPCGHHGDLEVVRVGHELALDGAGEEGVPAQLQRPEQGELVAEGLPHAGQLHGEHPVAPGLGVGKNVSKYLTAAVEGVPGHGGRPFFAYRWYVPTVWNIPSAGHP